MHVFRCISVESHFQEVALESRRRPDSVRQFGVRSKRPTDFIHIQTCHHQGDKIQQSFKTRNVVRKTTRKIQSKTLRMYFGRFFDICIKLQVNFPTTKKKSSLPIFMLEE